MSKWFLIIVTLLALFLGACLKMLDYDNQNRDAARIRSIARGVWELHYGEPEAITPTRFRQRPVQDGALQSLAGGDQAPFDLSQVRFLRRGRGCRVELPLDESEQIYGFGLQVNSFRQRGLRKQLICNAYPVGNVGFAHAPVPFYVSTNGYGVFIDTSRYVTFYCGTHQRPSDLRADSQPESDKRSTMVVDIPIAQGVDLYVFAGPTMLNAIQRYNLYSGGGCLPALWGLGVKYRTKSDFAADDVVRIVEYFRKNDMPCDMLGLEPGWQTRAYSSSYVWDPERFPDPDAFISRLKNMDFKINIWQHAYVHPDSPLHGPLTDRAGDYLVWGGLVPDFADESTRQVFSDYHENYLVKNGISAFKIDECDNANYSNAADPWGFPECTAFPSGIDGEQMHGLFGILYQKTMLGTFERNNLRTYGDVRASQGLAAPYPFVLYSDLYDHRQYARMLANAGFSGLLFSPEVRQCGSVEELVRRLELCIFAPLTCVDSWMIRNPPWLQYNKTKNNNDQLLDNAKEVEAMCRKLLRLRMRLIPYLYAAFAKYRYEGVPPCRPLVTEHQDDQNVHGIEDEFLVGDVLLVAPIFAGQKGRDVYLPAGDWHCLWTGQQYQGAQSHSIEMELERIPVFVKDNSILPLAEPVNAVRADTIFKVTAYVFGKSPRPTVLFEDDGVSNDFERGESNWIELTWSQEKGSQILRKGRYQSKRYEIIEWVHDTGHGVLQ